MRANRSHLYQLFEFSLRIYTAAMVFIYAVGKLGGGQFYRRQHLPADIAEKKVADLSGFELAWTFFGYDYAYILFIGLGQLTGALLLLFPRTRLLGVILLLPIMANIVIVDALYGIPTGALLSASVYLGLLLAITALNFRQVKEIWQAITQNQVPHFSGWHRLWYAAAAFALAVTYFFVESRVLRELI